MRLLGQGPSLLPPPGSNPAGVAASLSNGQSSYPMRLVFIESLITAIGTGAGLALGAFLVGVALGGDRR